MFILIVACKKTDHPVITMPVEKYKMLKEIPDSFEKVEKFYEKSKVEIVFDFNSGKFKGKYKTLEFKGKYNILKVSSGFTKGFNYKVELESLIKNATEDKVVDDFVRQLAICNRIYVAPDNLVNTKYVRLEMSNAENEEKIKFVLLK
ncbi:hypothetical protein [Lacihabitans sp. LS3-19]|uniref:hypothetical protein n=1 Tax=Lacihabitans sp. LS3-19 TaxID=2487335 RepID=UPI0020CD7CFE|nr:hypothetical protein [Lacihabitans sp. LS3-19]